MMTHKSYRALAAALVIGSPLMLYAKGNISGTVMEKETGEPLSYATIQLIDAATGKALALGANSDDNGKFIIKEVPDGKYLVRVTNLGSVTRERPVTIAGADADAGVITLGEDTKVLQEVVVEGVRSQMRFELDKKVFQVDANIVAAGQSASELLESIPSVEVDQDGEVSLRGDSSVTVWINGKESGLSADNRAQILEQIPGESIERIEVITNPSAKYSPEGTAGIINIVLKKDRKGGYFGSAEIGANSRGGGNASVNFNYNNSRWETYASVGFRMRHNKGGSKTRRTFTDFADRFLNSDADSRNHGNNVFVRAGVTYHLSDKDAFYLNGFGMFGHRWGNTTTDYSANIPDQWSRNMQRTTNKSDNRGAHAEIGYTRKWSDTHTLDVMASYNHWGGPIWHSYFQQQEFPGETPLTNAEYQEQTQNIGLNSIEAKIDYSNQVLPWLKVEAGFNGNYSHENTPVTTFEGTSASDMQLQPQLFNRFIYANNVSALYVTLGGKVKNFSFSAGLRGEAWQIHTKSLEYGQAKEDVPYFNRNQFALFPSAYLSYALPRNNEIQINYTRRIRRPFGGQLNSFMDIADPTNISYGNPQLDPQYSNSFELNYIKTWDQHMISASAYMRTANDHINRISFYSGDVMYTTYANVSDEINSGLELVVKNNLFRSHLDLTTTINLYNNHISSWKYSLTAPTGEKITLGGEKKNSFEWDARVMANVRLPWNISFQATGRYSSGHMTAQGSHNGGWSVDAGLRKTFGDWSVSLNCRDIFDSRKFKSTIDGVGYVQHSERWRGGRTLQLTIKYSFGNLKQKAGRNPATEQPVDGSGYGSEGME